MTATTTPPSTAPDRLPLPPRMRAAYTTMRNCTWKLSGYTPSWNDANMLPASPAIAAPLAKATSFRRLMGTVMISAASASSWIARQARPVRDRSRK